MVKIELIVREIGRLKPDYSLKFELPEIPRAGEYISVQRPDHPEPYGEDMIVRQVWWRLNHAETGGMASKGNEKTGGLTEVFVECEPATGPYSSDHWRQYVGSGADRPELEVSRLSVRESDLK